jgi:hypothetical protein
LLKQGSQTLSPKEDFPEVVGVAETDAFLAPDFFSRLNFLAEHRAQHKAPQSLQ